MKSAKPLKVPFQKYLCLMLTLPKAVEQIRNCVPTVNWNIVSITRFSSTGVLLTLSRLRNIRQTLCNLTSNLMFQTPITCVNTPLSLLRV